MTDSWLNCRTKWPWPENRPSAPLYVTGEFAGWFGQVNEKALLTFIPPAKQVLEIGSWLGCSTRWLLDRVDRVVAIDHWKGGREHQINPVFDSLLPVLYDTFLTNCWEYRERLVAVRENSVDGIKAVQQTGWVPDLIYLDGGHDYPDVSADLEVLQEYYPHVPIVGDDWWWGGVRQAVQETSEKYDRKFTLVEGLAWILE